MERIDQNSSSMSSLCLLRYSIFSLKCFLRNDLLFSSNLPHQGHLNWVSLVPLAGTPLPLNL